MKYHLMENENKELMKLSVRLRTFSSHATVMYAKGTDYSILEVSGWEPVVITRHVSLFNPLRQNCSFPKTSQADGDRK